MWSPFGPFWSVKYIFSQKQPLWTIHHTFVENRHIEVTKNLHSTANIVPLAITMNRKSKELPVKLNLWQSQ